MMPAIALLFTAHASPAEAVALEVAAVYGWDESSPHRLRPSTLTARLEAVAPACIGGDALSSYGGGSWSGRLQSSTGGGAMAGRQWSGGIDGSQLQIDGGTYTDNGELYGRVGGVAVSGIWVRVAGTTGVSIALTGCAPGVMSVGQSNAVGGFGALSGAPVEPGRLFLDLERTTYPRRVGPESGWVSAGYDVTKYAIGNTSITDWLDGGLLDGAISRSREGQGITTWTQGEADSRSMADAMAYAGRVESLFARIEDARGPQLFVWPMLSMRRNLEAQDVINAGMLDLATTRTDLVIVETDDLPKRDQVHYTAEAYPVLGSRMVDAVTF